MNNDMMGYTEGMVGGEQVTWGDEDPTNANEYDQD